MDAGGILAKFETTLAQWRATLDALDDEAFARDPPDGGWSAARICGHVGDVADMLLGNAEQCARGDGEDKGFQFMPAMITAVGSLPPVRIKVPPLPEELQHLSRPEALDRDEALARLGGMQDRMRALRDPVAASSPRMRREHPAGGWMNARHWYQMNEMHLRHHLRQLQRLR